MANYEKEIFLMRINNAYKTSYYEVTHDNGNHTAVVRHENDLCDISTFDCNNDVIKGATRYQVTLEEANKFVGEISNWFKEWE